MTARSAAPACEPVGEVRCMLGESPLWHAEERCLYWIDATAGLLHRFDPRTERTSTLGVTEPIGALVQGDDGALLALGNEGRIHVVRDFRVTHTLQGTPELRGLRFNDAIVDAHGRLWCGVVSAGPRPQDYALRTRTEQRLRRALRMPARHAPDPELGLYRFSEAEQLIQHVTDIGLSNGLGFDTPRTRLFHADSRARCIYVYPFDAQHGSLGPRAVFASFTSGSETPDGLTLDAQDQLWVALWGGNAIVRIDSRGNVVERIAIPARNVTSVAFGGDELGDLYVTTAEQQDDPASGRLFRLRLGDRGIHGLPEHHTPLTRLPHTPRPSPFRAPQRILVTGASGDIGRKLTAHLRGIDDVELVLLDREPHHLQDVERVDLAAPMRGWSHHFERVDAVVHLAGVPTSSAVRRETQRDNVDATRNVLDACVAHGVRRIVFASTNHVLAGYRDGDELLTPRLPPRPMSAYGDSKLTGERLCQQYSARHALSAICLRLGAIPRGISPAEAIYDPWFRAMWLSNRDLCQVFERALAVHDVRYAVLNAMSDNHPSRWDLGDTCALLGYAPQDGYRPELAARAADAGRQTVARLRSTTRRIREAFEP